MSNACFMAIELDEGWQFIETGIAKLKRIIEGQPEPQFIGEEYMMLYTTIFNMCNQKGPDDCSRQLYDKYKEVYNEYLNSVVLPSLREKNDEFMLRELVKRWTNHKLMVGWLSRLFNYLDRYFIPRAYLPSLNEVGITCFRDTVYAELMGKVKTVVLALIDRDREGEQVDRALLKNVLDIFVEIGMGEMKYYVDDFEKDLLAETAAYYSQEASYMNAEGYSFPLYMCKGEECIRLDKERMARYIHSSTVPKILQVSVSTLEKKYSKKSRYEK